MSFETINPHSGEIIDRHSVDSNEDISDKLKKSQVAYKAWKDFSVDKRCQYIFQLKTHLTL